MPPRMNREQRALIRLLQLTVWVQQRGADGFTFADVKEQFPDDYRGTDQADRLWTRDKTQLRRTGLRIRKTARGVYKVDSSASRARALRLTEQEVAVLDDVAVFIPSVPFPNAAHHLDKGLRKLVLSGVPLRSGTEGRAAATRAAWNEANASLPDLEGIPGLRPVVELVYPDPETGSDVRHTVKITKVHLRNRVIVGISDRTGQPEVFLGALVKSLRPAQARGSKALGDPGWQMSGYLSLVDGLADEVSRKWNAYSGAAPRRNVTSMQRSLAVGYLLLNAMIEAAPAQLPWKKAMRLSGAGSRKELDSIVEVLEEATFPSLGDQFGILAIEKSDDGIGLYMRHEGIPRLALRPVEVAMLLAAARAASADTGALASLSRKLLGLLAEDERKFATQLAATFDFGATP